MSDEISMFLLDHKKNLFLLEKHIEIRDAFGTPLQHTTGWMNKELLAKNPAWLHFLAQKMAEKISIRMTIPSRTVIVCANNYQASVYAAMLGAELSSDEARFTDVQTVIMNTDEKPPRRIVTMNEGGYRAAKRIIVADVAAYTLQTLGRIVQQVRQDHARSEILVACAMHLKYREIDSATREVLKDIHVLLGPELMSRQFGIIKHCTECRDQKPLTHVFDPVRGLRVYDAKQEEQERTEAEERSKALEELDEIYQKKVRAGETPDFPVIKKQAPAASQELDPQEAARIEGLRLADDEYQARVRAGEKPPIPK